MCDLAPADEYFGRMRMSILGSRLALVDDALRDWRAHYPRDTWLPRMEPEPCTHRVPRRRRRVLPASRRARQQQRPPVSAQAHQIFGDEAQDVSGTRRLR